MRSPGSCRLGLLRVGSLLGLVGLLACDRGSPTSPAAPSPAPALTIVSVGWEWTGVGRDYLWIQCLVRDEQGDPLAVSLAIETESCLARDVCWRSAAALAERAGPEAQLRKAYGYVDFGTRIRGGLVCTATRPSGERATRSVPICIDGPGPEGGPCLAD